MTASGPRLRDAERYHAACRYPGVHCSGWRCAVLAAFRRGDEPTSGRGPSPASRRYEEAFGPALCRDFDFLLQSETAARFEQDRLVIRPTSAYHPSGS